MKDVWLVEWTEKSPYSGLNVDATLRAAFTNLIEAEKFRAELREKPKTINVYVPEKIKLIER